MDCRITDAKTGYTVVEYSVLESKNSEICSFTQMSGSSGLTIIAVFREISREVNII